MLTVGQARGRLKLFRDGGRWTWPRRLDPSKRVQMSAARRFSYLDILRRYRFPVTGLLQVGANDGAELLDLGPVGDLPLLLIEPLQAPFRRLEHRARGKANVRLMQFAASDAEGTAEMYVASNNEESSSLLSPEMHLLAAPQVTFPTREVVRVCRLDSVVAVNHPYNSWILDAQGAELAVLRGAGNTLDEVDSLFIEVNRVPVYSGCALVSEIDDFLADLGYVRVLTRWWGWWGDAMYSRSGSGFD